MRCDHASRESYLVRLWAEPDDDQFVLRGFIQDVRTGRKTYFTEPDFPARLLRESAERLTVLDGRPAVA